MASIQIFLITSTCFLYLVGAGLFSKSVWLFENYQARFSPNWHIWIANNCNSGARSLVVMRPRLEQVQDPMTSAKASGTSM